MARAACKIRAFLVPTISFIGRRPFFVWQKLCACLEIAWPHSRAYRLPSLCVSQAQVQERVPDRVKGPEIRQASLQAIDGTWLHCDCVPPELRRRNDRPEC